MNSKIQQGINFVQSVFQDEQFYVALRHVIGSFLPLILGEMFGFQRLGLELMLGAFFVSGVDIAGTLRSKTSALLTTTVLSISITFLILLTAGALWSLLPVLFVLIFGLAFISPFSLRYTMMGIMGYIAIILGLATSGGLNSTHDILIHCFYLLCGACWYIIFALSISYFSRLREINRRIAFCIRQTADYFDQRLALLKPETDHHEGLLELAGLQKELNETQESVRELLFENPTILRDHNSKRHRFLVIFIELIDIHELTMATPVDYPRIRELLHHYPEYDIIRKIISRLNQDMHNLADFLLHDAEYYAPEHLQEYLDQLHEDLQELKQKTSLDDSKEEEAYHTLKQIEQYLQQQLQKIQKVQDAVLAYRSNDTQIEETETDLPTEVLPRFISPNPLNWNSLIDNISFESSYFRYALRSATTAIAGYALAYFIHFQNPYWVLLTVLIVMKPGYGVTKKRFFHRIAGTIAGALLAYGLYQFHPSHLTSLAIFGLSYLLAFTFVVENYAIASCFFTLFVIFLYSFLNRQIPTAILFRVADTVMGAILVIVAIFYLWPHWEHQKFSYYLNKSLRANKNYLQEVISHLFGKSFNKTDYRLSRKYAYVDMANVTSSFYRLKDDPESKQKNARSFHNLALLNYMLLAAITSLANFLQRHSEQPLAYYELRKLGNNSLSYLKLALQKLEKSTTLKHHSTKNTETTDNLRTEKIDQKLYELKKQLDQQGKPMSGDNKVYVEYVRLNFLKRQLIWMMELCESINDHVNDYSLDK